MVTRLITNNNEVRVLWVLAHAGVRGNEVAGGMAKEAAENRAHDVPDEIRWQVSLVVNSRCHTQSGQEMDQIRICDIGWRNIGPTVRSVDRVLENSSEVGEKADYPVYHQPCKKETDGGP